MHVIGSLDPGMGGPPVVAVRLAAAQAMLGHEVTVVAHTSPGREAQVQAALAQVPGMDQVGLKLLEPPESLREKITARQAGRLLAPTIARHDILQLHGVWEPLLRISARQAGDHNVPYVMTPHGMLDPWSLSQSRYRKKLAWALGYRRMYDRAAYIHTLNDDEAALLEPLRLRAPKRVFPNGVFLEEIQPLPQPGRFYALRPELEGRPYVLFLSRLHYKKGLDYLAQAFAAIAPKHPMLQLVVAGPDGGTQAEFESRIARAGLTERVHVVGPIYGKDKYAAMIDAVCFCLPSRQEGFSMAITEAMLCGCPVVITEACHYPQVAEVGAGRVVPLEGDAVAAALDDVVSNPHVRADMGQAGRTLVTQRFTWPKIAAQTLEAYGQVRPGLS